MGGRGACDKAWGLLGAGHVQSRFLQAMVIALPLLAAAPVFATDGIAFDIPAQPFDPSCVELVRQGAASLGFSAREIVSGAGHDAVYVARHVPTAMIFTPCKDGLSHNEAESIEPDEAEAGGQVLFQAVLARANRAV